VTPSRHDRRCDTRTTMFARRLRSLLRRAWGEVPSPQDRLVAKWLRGELEHHDPDDLLIVVGDDGPAWARMEALDFILAAIAAGEPASSSDPSVRIPRAQDSFGR